MPATTTPLATLAAEALTWFIPQGEGWPPSVSEDAPTWVHRVAADAAHGIKCHPRDNYFSSIARDALLEIIELGMDGRGHPVRRSPDFHRVRHSFCRSLGAMLDAQGT